MTKSELISEALNEINKSKKRARESNKLQNNMLATEKIFDRKSSYCEKNKVQKAKMQVYKNDFEIKGMHLPNEWDVLPSFVNIVDDKVTSMSNCLEQINFTKNDICKLHSLNEKKTEENAEIKELKENMSKIQLEMFTLKNLILKIDEGNQSGKNSLIATKQFATPDNRNKGGFESHNKLASGINSHQLKFHFVKQFELKVHSEAQRTKMELHCPAKTKEEMMRGVSRDRGNLKSNVLKSERELEKKHTVVKPKKSETNDARPNEESRAKAEESKNKKVQSKGNKNILDSKVSFGKEFGKEDKKK